jgi:hypothetical protein
MQFNSLFNLQQTTLEVLSKTICGCEVTKYSMRFSSQKNRSGQKVALFACGPKITMAHLMEAQQWPVLPFRL